MRDHLLKTLGEIDPGRGSAHALRQEGDQQVQRVESRLRVWRETGPRAGAPKALWARGKTLEVVND